VRRAIALIGALAGGIVCVWILTVVMILWAGARPSQHDADVILVLGAAQYNGRPSPVLKARLDHAIALYRAGRARRVIFTGGVGAGDTVSEGEVARRYALEEGVPDSVILVDRKGETSAASVDAAAELMHEKGLNSALLVSDSYHMLRLELLARRAGIVPFRAPAPHGPIDRDVATHRHYVLRESVLLPAQAILGAR
jgi:uncharacterized SAM-binding protein YcdF (DUF218 family)